MLSIKPTQSKAPKAVISMKDLNAVFQPEKISHAHGLQISYLQDERIRNLFVYHDNGQVSSSAILFTFLTDKLESIKPVAQTPHQCGLSRLLSDGNTCDASPANWKTFLMYWISVSSSVAHPRYIYMDAIYLFLI